MNMNRVVAKSRLLLIAMLAVAALEAGVAQGASSRSPGHDADVQQTTQIVTIESSFGDIDTLYGGDGSRDDYQAGVYNPSTQFRDWAKNTVTGGGTGQFVDLRNSDTLHKDAEVSNEKFPFILTGYPRFDPNRVRRAILRLDFAFPVVSSPGSDTIRFWNELDTTGVYTAVFNHGLRANDWLNKRHPKRDCTYDPGNRNCAVRQWLNLEVNLLDGSVRGRPLYENGEPAGDYEQISPSGDVGPAWGAAPYELEIGKPRGVLELAADGSLYGLLEDDTYLSYVALAIEADVDSFVVDMVADSSETNHRACTQIINDCSLRGALFRAWARPGLDAVTLPSGVYDLTVATISQDLALTGDLDIHDDVALVGANSANTLIIARNNDRVFEVWNGGNLIMSGVGVGSATPIGSILVQAGGRTQLKNVIVGGYGRGIENNSGEVTISDSLISENTTNGIYNAGGHVTMSTSRIYDNDESGVVNRNGGIFTAINSVISLNNLPSNSVAYGGGVFNQPASTVKLIGGELSYNQSKTNGGGIYNEGNLVLLGARILSNTATSGGGVFNASGTFAMTDSTISANGAAEDGGGVFNDGEISGKVERSTISGNTAGRYGGGIHHGRLFSPGGGTLTLDNSTISGNTAGVEGGGLYALNGARFDLTHSTVAFNTAQYGGALGVFNAPAARVKSTILANNVSASQCNPRGAAVSANDNIFGDDSCASLASDDRITDPMLDPLASNVGRTATHALKPGSPALDRITIGAGPATDQRNLARPQPYDGNCDIGAYEVEQYKPPTTPTTPTASFSSNNHPGGALGSAWLGDASTTHYSVADDELDVGAGGPIYWQPQVFGAGQRAAVTFVHVDTSNIRQALLLKVQGDGWVQGAIAASYDSSAQQISIETHVSGAGWTTLATWAAVLRDGDQLSAIANADGSARVFVNDAEVGSANAGSFFSGKGGRVGLWFVNAEETVLDDFVAATTEAMSMKQTFLPILTK